MFLGFLKSAKNKIARIFETEMDRIEAAVKQRGVEFAATRDKSLALKTIIHSYINSQIKVGTPESKGITAAKLKGLKPRQNNSPTALWQLAEKFNTPPITKSLIKTNLQDSAFDKYMPDELQDIITEYGEDDLFENNMALCRRVLNFIEKYSGYQIYFNNHFCGFLCEKLCQALDIDGYARQYKVAMDGVRPPPQSGGGRNEPIAACRFAVLKAFFSGVPEQKLMNRL